jgi:hypothetical protein
MKLQDGTELDINDDKTEGGSENTGESTNI